MKLFKQPCQFIAGVNTPGKIPIFNLPEVAFIGRSNVGKSSIINAIFNNKNIAKVSSRPGRTRQINFFELDNSIIIVDLPGYGYAKLSKSELNRLRILNTEYLTERSQLRRVFLLIDSRHGLKPNDIEAMFMLDEAGTSYQIVLTKYDKAKKSELENIKNNIISSSTNHPAMLNNILCTSSKEKLGLSSLQLEISNILC